MKSMFSFWVCLFKFIRHVYLNQNLVISLHTHIHLVFYSASIALFPLDGEVLNTMIILNQLEFVGYYHLNYLCLTAKEKLPERSLWLSVWDYKACPAHFVRNGIKSLGKYSPPLPHPPCHASIFLVLEVGSGYREMEGNTNISTVAILIDNDFMNRCYFNQELFFITILDFLYEFLAPCRWVCVM